MKYRLGINCSGFLSSACLLAEDGIRAAICEERLSRVKQDRDFPLRAIGYCLDVAGIELLDLEAVHVGWHPRFYLQKSDRTQLEAFRERGRISYLALNELATLLQGEIRDVRQELVMEGGRLEIRFVDHHRAHVANAFHRSGFEAADFLVLDGFGEVSTGLCGVVAPQGTTVLASLRTPHSIGSLYSAFTDFLGFRPNRDEWKVMALSALGDPDRYAEAVRALIRVDGLRLELDLSYFEHFLFFTPRYYSEKFASVFGKPLEPGEPPSERHCDVVAALQRVCEEVVFALLGNLAQRGGGRHLVVGGGFFMNSVCNGKLLANTPYQDLFVGGSPDDTGISVGSAFQGAAEAGWELLRERARHNAFGRTYEPTEIRAALERRRIPFRAVADPAAEAAARLAQHQVIGWFEGGSEFGQRALGHRSILANPTRAETKAHVNATVKYREPFRPFAPAVLAERQAELFPGLDGQCSDFMERVFTFDSKWAERLPAVVHANGSGRLQTVDSRVHPRFHALIREFERRTGAPAVLNTSFNTNGVPLVETPGDAIRCFFDSGLDALLLGDFLVEKSPVSGSG